jgi:hypothetical protein
MGSAARQTLIVTHLGRLAGSVAVMLYSCAAAAMSQECIAVPDAGSGALVQRWTYAQDELLICSYGTAPAQLRDDRWQGSEPLLGVLNAGAGC